MYLPAHFEQQDAGALHWLMRTRPLATLVTQSAQGIDANHIPLLLVTDGDGLLLRGHVARANPLCQDLASGAAALAIFHGPEQYITPSWYASKAADGRVVPTWNYAVVHARGPLTLVSDIAWLRALLEAQTQSQEMALPKPWQVGDAPADYLDKMMAAIVGIEMRVTDLKGKWKLSQNRSLPDRQGVIAGLQAEGSDDALKMAAWVPPA